MIQIIKEETDNGVTTEPPPTVPPYYTDSTDDPLIDEFAIKVGWAKLLDAHSINCSSQFGFKFE